MAILRSRRMCPFCPWAFLVIRIDVIWLATEPKDMRAGTETALARVIAIFGAAQPHCSYLFANRRATRIKVRMQDGFGVWLAARRLTQGKFYGPSSRHGCPNGIQLWSLRRACPQLSGRLERQVGLRRLRRLQSQLCSGRD